MLASCGGGEGTAAFVVPLQVYNEEASFVAIRAKLTDAGVRILQVQCGFVDGAKLPFDQQVAWPGGHTQRAVYFTVVGTDAEDAEALRIDGFRRLTPASTQANSDPFDCAWLPP